jgi:hypothetical protein
MCNLDSFEKYTARFHPRGLVIGDRLFLSPRLLERQETIRGILTHELSHLHFSKTLGMYHAFQELPAWFGEGLAVSISRGGGAEKITESEAAEFLSRHTVFQPDASGSLFYTKGAGVTDHSN